MLPFDRILVPIDFSEPAEQTLAYAVELARVHDARLLLLHVVRAPSFPSFYGTGAVALYGEVPDLERRARDALETLAADAGKEAVPIETHVARGDASAEIVTFAEAQGVDLVVVASRGRSGVRKVLLGSVAEKVVRHAPCPVLVVRDEVVAAGPDRAAEASDASA